MKHNKIKGEGVKMLSEIAKNESGEIIWEKPYPFRRLFKEGQGQVVDGQSRAR